MDRNLMRKMAKVEYKKMLKGVKGADRPSFAQAWPLIKATLEGKAREGKESQVQLSVEEDAVLEQMLAVEEAPEAPDAPEVVKMIELEHVHGEGCEHEVRVEI